MNLDNVAIEELQVGGYVNYAADTLGIDSPKHCFSLPHYQRFNHDVNYLFNYLGYREPDNYTKNAIICIGDSFTVGLGLPVSLTYPKQLQRLLGHPVLNFGLNGASNEWIARKLGIILKYFNPPAIIVHYSFSHRRESPESDWLDDERTMCDEHKYTEADNYNNWLECYSQISSLPHNVIHSFIPKWHTAPTYPPNAIVPKVVDYARDGFHYGAKTSELLAKTLASTISNIGALAP